MKKIIISLVSISMVLALTVKATEVILTPSTPATSVTTAVSNEEVFTRNLSVGSYGRDVMALKKILGLELGVTLDTTPSFTANTLNYAKQFQEKYAVEVLIPVGLSAGTGFVGASTRAKLNPLATKYFVKLSDFTLPAQTAVSQVKEVFLTNLKLGSVGPDVTLLKTILNSDESTALIPKNTTEIFDLATEIAVIKFQDKYASEVLIPSGLTKGTGFVGPSTRKKLNAIVNSLLPQTQTATTQTTTTQTTQTSSFQPYSYTYVPSTSVTVPDFGVLIREECEGANLIGIYANGQGGTYRNQITANSSKCSTNYQPGIIPSYIYNPPSSSGIISSTTKKITAFSFPSTSKTASVINETAKTITVYTPPLYTYEFQTVPNPMFGILGMISGLGSTKIGVRKTAPTYSLSTITPTITFQGKSISPASGVAQNFTNPVKYTVTANDNSTTTYTVTTKPVTCPNYSDGIPFGGKITNISEVNVVWPGGEPGESEPWQLKVSGGSAISTLLKAYKVTVQEVSTPTAETPVIEYYCGKPTSLDYLYWQKPAENSYVLGTSYAYPTVWVNIIPKDCPSNWFCSYRQLRLVKNSSLNY